MDANIEKEKDVTVVTPIQKDKTGVQVKPEIKEETSEQKTARELAEKEAAEKLEQEAAEKLAEEEKLRIEKEKQELALDKDKIEIDGVVYNIDENGNAILEGKIIHSKSDIDNMLAELEKDNNSNPIATIQNISEKSGIIPTDENGNLIEYEMSVEGLAKRESDIYNIGKGEGFNEGFSQFLKSNPDIAEIIEYKRNFGTIEGYSINEDYTKANLPTSDDELYQLIIKAEIQKGTSLERAKRLADFAKNNNSLKEDAEECLNYLKRIQEDKIKTIREQQDIAQKEARQADIKFYGIDYDNTGKEIVANVQGSIYDSIMVKGEVKGYSIPLEGLNIRTPKGVRKVSRKELFDYVSKPVFQDTDGIVYTQAQLDDITIANNPQEYLLRCISNLDGGVESLVKKAIGDKEVLKIRKISTEKYKSKSGNQKTMEQESDKKIQLVLPVNKRN